MKALPMEGDEEEPYSETYSFAFQYADGLMKSIDFLPMRKVLVLLIIQRRTKLLC